MNLLNKFIKWLEQWVGVAIYVWGGNGQEMTPSKIKSMETLTTNYNRALNLYNARKNSGINPIIGFDCSGLISKFLQNEGYVTKKRNCNHLSSMCEKIYARGEGGTMQPGDLVFRWSSSNKYYHVGVYVGNNTVIESKGRDDGVVKQNINASGSTYWNKWGRLKILSDIKTMDKTVLIIGGTVNIRDQASTKGESVKIAKRGEQYPLIAVSSTGWYQIGEKQYISNSVELTKLV